MQPKSCPRIIAADCKTLVHKTWNESLNALALEMLN